MGNLMRWLVPLSLLNWAIMSPAPEWHIRVLIFLETSGAETLVERSLLKMHFSCASCPTLSWLSYLFAHSFLSLCGLWSYTDSFNVGIAHDLAIKIPKVIQIGSGMFCTPSFWSLLLDSRPGEGMRRQDYRSPILQQDSQDLVTWAWSRGSQVSRGKHCSSLCFYRPVLFHCLKPESL